MSLQGTRIVVGVTGGVAAFKSVELVRELTRRGASVRVVMTRSAARFVGPITFTGLLGAPPVTDLWDPSYRGEVHVELGEWADAMVVAPATMQFLASAAHGFADDPVLATYACMRGLMLVAPAMHTRMFERPATQRNLELLRRDGVTLVGPVGGPLASGEIGMGRMSEPVEIAEAVARALDRRADLDGKTVVVSAGPTYEDLDPVRFLGNRSTGKMGYAIAARAAARGARVVLVSGPSALTPPAGVELERVRSAREMHAAVMARKSDADAIIMTAAVADYRPEVVAEQKIKKGDELVVKMVRNPDILAELGAGRSGPRPVLVGFALETSDVEGSAKRKLERKGVDLVVGNQASDGFAGDTNKVVLVAHDETVALPLLPKLEVADAVLDKVRALCLDR
jgi:phosphopantothenoylcysteine decarboxylase / phosphopantothenate---cysteine ligase